jgi:hypothetical protein
MHDTMLTISYESLGKILHQLQDAPEIQNSPELAGQVRSALSFHQQMSVEVQALKQEQQSLRQEISDLSREPGERICNQPSTNQFGKYEEMRERGSSPQEVYLATQQDGLDEVASISVMRRVFHLSVSDAQVLISQAENAMKRPHAA